MNKNKRFGKYQVVDNIKAHGWSICIDMKHLDRFCHNRVFAYPTYRESRIVTSDLCDRNDPSLPVRVTEMMDFYILAIGVRADIKVLREITITRGNK